MTNVNALTLPYLPDVRPRCLEVAHKLLNNKVQCHYSELSNRWEWRAQGSLAFPFFGDCSSTFTAIDWFAGAADPNNLNFSGGNTKSMLAHANAAKLIRPRAQMLAADGCFFGMGSDGVTPIHVAMALQPGTVRDPLFFNMGSKMDPSIDPLSVLLGIGKPIFFRNVTRNRNPAPRH